MLHLHLMTPNRKLLTGQIKELPIVFSGPALDCAAWAREQGFTWYRILLHPYGGYWKKPGAYLFAATGDDHAETPTVVAGSIPGEAAHQCLVTGRP
jgi:hypothetical protein